MSTPQVQIMIQLLGYLHLISGVGNSTSLFRSTLPSSLWSVICYKGHMIDGMISNAPPSPDPHVLECDFPPIDHNWCSKMVNSASWQETILNVYCWLYLSSTLPNISHYISKFLILTLTSHPLWSPFSPFSHRDGSQLHSFAIGRWPMILSQRVRGLTKLLKESVIQPYLSIYHRNLATSQTLRSLPSKGLNKPLWSNLRRLRVEAVWSMTISTILTHEISTLLSQHNGCCFTLKIYYLCCFII
jgi:hypothetical protein